MGLQWQCAQPLYLILVFHDSVMAQDWSPGRNVAGLGEEIIDLFGEVGVIDK